MKIHCRTNLDLFNEQWPDEMPTRPVVGDIITSKRGLELQVVRITFKFSGEMQVELHLVPSRFECISQFETWYNHIFLRDNQEMFHLKEKMRIAKETNRAV